jgi:hypothetical protein
MSIGTTLISGAVCLPTQAQQPYKISHHCKV